MGIGFKDSKGNFHPTNNKKRINFDRLTKSSEIKAQIAGIHHNSSIQKRKNDVLLDKITKDRDDNRIKHMKSRERYKPKYNMASDRELKIRKGYMNRFNSFNPIKSIPKGSNLPKEFSSRMEQGVYSDGGSSPDNFQDGTHMIKFIHNNHDLHPSIENPMYLAGKKEISIHTKLMMDRRDGKRGEIISSPIKKGLFSEKERYQIFPPK